MIQQPDLRTKPSGKKWIKAKLEESKYITAALTQKSRDDNEREARENNMSSQGLCA